MDHERHHEQHSGWTRERDAGDPPDSRGDATTPLPATGRRAGVVASVRLDEAVALARQVASERDVALTRLARLEHEVVHAAAVRDVHTRQAQALASNLWRLERQVSALLASRRWRIGRRVGNALDRVLLRRRDMAEDLRIQQLLERGRRLLGTVGETEVQLEAERGRALAEAVPRKDFDLYLREALTDPLLETPLDATGQHAVDVMDAYRDLLVRRWGGRTRGPKVSVVMPTFNRSSLLPRALGSVLEQSYENWELVVVDDGSTDGTDSLLAGYTDPRITFVRLQGNCGVSYARNRGLERTTGELIAYLDSDNYWDEHYLLLMAGTLEEHPARGSAYCAQRIWEVVPDEVTGEPKRRLDGIRFAPFNRALLENRNYIDLNAFVHRRDAVPGDHTFDESLPRLVDWDLFLRMTAASRPVALPCLLSHYEFGVVTDQLTRTIPVRPATKAIDDVTLHQATPALPLPEPVAVRYRNPRLHAPVGGSRPARDRRPLSVFVHGTADGRRLRLCLDAVRTTTPGQDVRFVLQGGVPDAAARAAVAGVAADPDVEVLAQEEGTMRRQIERVAADGRDALLLGAEVVVMPGWLEACVEVLATLPDTGLVAPRMVVLPGTLPFTEHVPYAKTYRELDVTLSRRDRNVLDPYLDDVRGFVELAWARLTCAYLPREAVMMAGAPELETASANFGPTDGLEHAARLYSTLLRICCGLRVVYTPHAKVYFLP